MRISTAGYVAFLPAAATLAGAEAEAVAVAMDGGDVNTMGQTIDDAGVLTLAPAAAGDAAGVLVTHCRTWASIMCSLNDRLHTGHSRYADPLRCD